ncbi:flagellar filament capping protein FliD [Pararobbsia silviterrae]|uniref:Flagellar hook-associated protein 2 n=1 Tax=Pararobbsia silviterrae TaxID=1792498 RepID=A0A494X6S9_9BURK|nr:flagellar filament capping protein FliD [Pararobbsia silviterrae]RKP45341.1 flagellar hook protein FliD [Pararobbsia silviterrae]
MTSSVSSSTTSSTSTGKTTSAAEILAEAKAAAQAAAQTIISGSGIGSSMNLSSLMSGLMSVESVPLLQLEAQAADVDSQISAFGTLSSAFSTFEDSISELTYSSSFNTLSAATSDETVASAAINPGATAGSYTVNITQLAQSESLLATGVASTSTPIGTGATTTLNISLGTTTTTTNSDGTTSQSFTATAGSTVTPITIDSSNDTLEGIRTAINAANIGVTATIVNDGSGTPYRLAITSNTTGATEAISISVAGAGGTGTGDSTLTNMFTYNPGGTEDMTETSVAQNAQMTVNGTPIQSATNTADNSYPGLSIALMGVGTATITVGTATGTLEGLVDNFVTAYNAMQAAIAPLTQFDASDSDNNGPLIGNSTVQQLTSQIQQIVSGTVGGSTTYQQLADIGITLDATTGDLDLDSTTLEDALASNSAAFQALFGTMESATDPLVTAGTTGTTTPTSGTYAINVTQAATQGVLTGTASPAVPTAATQLSVNLNGTFASVTVPAGSYSSLSDYAAALQAAINGNSTYQSDGYGVTVSVDSTGTNLVVTSNTYGSDSTVQISGTDAATLFGSTTNTGVAGTDIQGSIGGYPATGSGQTLTASGNTPVSGITVTVTGSQTGSRGTVSYSTGIATQLTNVMNDAVAVQGTGDATVDGAITGAVDTLKDQVSQIEDQESTQQSYIDSVSAIYQAEFTALQTTLASMSSISSYLQEIFNPTTSSS